MSVLRLGLLTLTVLLSVEASAAASADDALLDAAQRGDRIAVARLLDTGADVKANVDGVTALHWAARAESLDTVKLLLKSGADPRAADMFGVTPLYLAAENGSAPVIAALLDAGADPNTVAPTGRTALMTAVRNGKLDAIALLLDRGAVLDARDTEFEQTALMIAVREGNSDAVALLLKRGADVNAHTRVGPTPAFIPPCKRTGCFSEGAGINRGGIPDRGRRPAATGGLTPLLYAARDGRTADAEQLLAAGADVELAEANGIRPLLMALLNNQLGVVELLLKQGADVNADDFWGRTPLFAAVEYRNRDLRNRDLRDEAVDREALLGVITRLIERGANVNARVREWPYSRTAFTSDLSWVDMTGQTPFLRAAQSGDTTVMRLLLAHGADPSIATFEGTTPLMAAAGVNWTVAQTYTESPQALIDAIDICLELGADVNAVNSMGVTAMIGAANRGSNDIIKLLYAKGARIDVVDKQGRSPARWAEGVFLATTGAELKPETVALLHELAADASPSGNGSPGKTPAADSAAGR
ncbi:MAG TPA: ankyrin repeat domain-containing protein [Gammaproteobacteria bacterium]|nr:ankyrin repeat domain-containing protein [Gammaproteobacteria bacterium]